MSSGPRPFWHQGLIWRKIIFPRTRVAGNGFRVTSNVITDLTGGTSPAWRLGTSGLGGHLLSVVTTHPQTLPQRCAGTGSFLGELWTGRLDALGGVLLGGCRGPIPEPVVSCTCSAGSYTFPSAHCTGPTCSDTRDPFLKFILWV